MRLDASGSAVLLVLLGGGFSPQPPTRAPDVTSRLRALLDAGSYVQAAAEAKLVADRLISSTDSSTIDSARALDLCVSAYIRNGDGADPQTLSAAERALTIRKRLAGDGDAESSLSLQHLGDVHAERGELALALEYHLKAVDICEQRSCGIDIAERIDHLASALIRLERFSEAQAALDRAMAVRAARAEADPLGLASTLDQLGWLNRYRGNYAAGLPFAERALALRREWAPNAPDTVGTTELLGDLQFLEGRIPVARSTWIAALELSQRSLRPDHPLTAPLNRRIAAAAKVLGDFVEAREHLEAGVRVADRINAPCAPERPALFDDLASLFFDEGEFIRARALYRRALDVFEQCLGDSHSRTATVVHNLAEVASRVGDLDEAARLHRRAIRLWSATLGPRHPFVARGLDALAEVVAARGDIAEARRLYARALDIRVKTVGDDHPDVAWTKTNLARLNLQAGDTVGALREITEAVAVYDRAGPADDPDHLARALTLWSEILERSGDVDAARDTALRALRTRREIFGDTHPLVAESLVRVAAVELAEGDESASLAAALEAERIGQAHTRFTVRYLPERSAMEFAARRARALDIALSLLINAHRGDDSQVADAVIRSRAMILDELAARARAASGRSAAALNDELARARQRFATLMLRSIGGEEPVARDLLEQARRQRDEAEQAFADSSAAARGDSVRDRAGVREVRDGLPPDTAIVSFVRYDRAIVGERRKVRTTASYAAFVLRPDAAEVSLVPLGVASTIDRAVATWHDQLRGALVAQDVGSPQLEVTYRRAGSQLRRRVWDPLAPAIEGLSHILIVPDGSLNLVSFAALPTATGRYVAEEARTIQYLSAERDVIAPGDHPGNAGLLAVGGPAFDSEAARPPAAAVRSPGCAPLGTMHFDSLPGSRQEIADVARLWSINVPERSTVLVGRDADETAVKKMMPGRRFVHFATHGFFLGESCAPVGGTRSVGGLSTATGRRTAAPVVDNPLLLSGLALAGANVRTPRRADADDGILSAEEVASLDLSGVDWVVLSACDTGLGELRAGEGVFGLRRAFQIAGARTVIMSLWSVDDQATREWMRALYRNRLERGLSTAESVREASLSVLRARRAAGLSTHPFYWGGFVAAGDWR